MAKRVRPGYWSRSLFWLELGIEGEDVAIRFRCLYDGTDFHGFQEQAGLITIQGELQRVLSALLGAGKVVGAGRTDSGVHATGQVVVWRGDSAIPLDRVAQVANGRLPRAIRLSEAMWVDESWDPIRSPNQKRYSYRLFRGEIPALPWLRYAWTCHRPLDFTVLEGAAALFCGTHDFRAFRGEGSSAKTTVRRVSVSRWIREEEGSIWRYEVQADGFLYHMVRMMVGAMVEDAGRMAGHSVVDGLAHPLGMKVAMPAPARGLTLEQVIYGESPHGLSSPPTPCPTVD